MTLVYDFSSGFCCPETRLDAPYAAPFTACMAPWMYEPFAFCRDWVIMMGMADISLMHEICGNTSVVCSQRRYGTQTIWKPWSAYVLACSPDVAYTPDFLPASCAAFRIFAMAALSSGSNSPSTGWPILFPKSYGPTKRRSMPSTRAISSTWNR